MSLVKSNSLQLGQSLTATNNFTLYQPASPDGTVRWGVGNSGSVTDIVTLNSSGNVGIGTSAPAVPLHVIGVVYAPNNGNNSFVMNSAGTYYGTIQNDAADRWSLGYGGSKTTLGTSVLTWNSSGNLGLGVTPSAWDATYKALQTPAGSIGAYSTTFFEIDQNAYWSSAGYKYVNNGYASQYHQTNGTHVWKNAPSGTAGNAISFTQAMTLDASGNLGVGTSSPGFKLDVQPSSIGGIRAVIDGNKYAYILNQAGTVGFQAYGSYGTAHLRMTYPSVADWDLLAGSSGQLGFIYNGSERMRIDSSGNVGIGTSSPDARLTAVGSSAASIVTVATIQNPINAAGTGHGARLVLHSTSATGRGVAIASSSDDNYAVSNGMLFYTSTASTLTERMRIDSSGNLLVGKTAAASAVQGHWFSPDGVWRTSKDGTGSNNHAVFINNAAGTPAAVGSITTSGSTTAYNTSSDYRLKENIQPMQNALATVAQLNPVTYTWKADGSDGQGFIAHELQAVVPDCVTGEKDAEDEDGNPVYQGIDTSFLVATLTAAIKEQQAIIESLTKRIETLEGA